MRQVTSRLISLLALITVGLVLPAVASAEDTYQSLAKNNPNFYGIEGYAQPEGNIENGSKIFHEGKGAVPACITCHQKNALGSDDLGAPRLAGQYYSYLIKEINDFATDRRKDDIMFTMNMVASKLSDQDKKDVLSYVATLRVGFDGSDVAALKKNGQVQDVGDLAKGKSIVKWGLNDRNPPIPACRSCHGANGRGAPPLFPMIGRQRYTYLISQLKSWREGAQESITPEGDGKTGLKDGVNKLGWLATGDEVKNICKKGRCNDPMAAMRKVAALLSDEDIRNAAAYLTQARLFGQGDVVAPYPNLVRADGTGGEDLYYNPEDK